MVTWRGKVLILGLILLGTAAGCPKLAHWGEHQMYPCSRVNELRVKTTYWETKSKVMTRLVDIDKCNRRAQTARIQMERAQRMCDHEREEH
jgi:hypothetical protein